jgi:prepilin-type N-terminal cleavage/methylation domain-containing protein
MRIAGAKYERMVLLKSRRNGANMKVMNRREAERWMNLGPKQEQGFTLIEVLAAIVILSIVSLVLTSYFTNALSFSKANQNKTIMVNLARNALFYMEKQDFDKLRDYFVGVPSIDGRPAVQGIPLIDGAGCNYLELGVLSCGPYTHIISDPDILAEVLNPTVNKVRYTITINYQTAIHREMLNPADQEKQEMAEHLLPVSVVVSGPGGVRASQKEIAVEGYITDEQIR